MTRGEKKGVTTYPYYEYNKDGLVTYFEQLFRWVKEGDDFVFKKIPIKFWYINEYDKDNNRIKYEDSQGNFWDKELMPDIPYPFEVNFKYKMK